MPDENPTERQTRKIHEPIDWDVRGIIAILALMGAFGLAIGQLLSGDTHGAEIPTWAAALVSAITGFYFGSRGGESH